MASQESSQQASNKDDKRDYNKWTPDELTVIFKWLRERNDDIYGTVKNGDANYAKRRKEAWRDFTREVWMASGNERTATQISKQIDNYRKSGVFDYN